MLSSQLYEVHTRFAELNTLQHYGTNTKDSPNQVPERHSLRDDITARFTGFEDEVMVVR